MAPGCSWCARNLDNIQTLSARTSNRFRFVGLSNTSKDLKRYLDSVHFQFPVEVVDVEHSPDGLNTLSTPQMAVVAPDGRVAKVWVGALAGSSQEEVERYFNVRLPGWRQEGHAQ